MKLARPDQPLVSVPYRVQRPIEVLSPNSEEAEHTGKLRRQIVVLPDICLQDGGMVGQAVEDVGSSQPLTFKLQLERAFPMNRCLLFQVSHCRKLRELRIMSMISVCW